MKNPSNPVHRYRLSTAQHVVDHHWPLKNVLLIISLLVFHPVSLAAPGNDAADDDTEIIIIDDAADDATEIIIDGGDDTDMLIIEEEPATGSADIDLPGDTTDVPETAADTHGMHHARGDFSIGIDSARVEYGNLYQSKSRVDSASYGHLAVSANWSPNPTWETRLGGRLDGYKQTGTPDYDDVDADYGDSYIRFRRDNYRITAGTQKVIWGRIDEISPTDRISRADLSRGLLDELPERRRAMPVIRFEGFQGNYKLDTVFIPAFREAYLPDKDSIWYPVNRTNGTILGIESSPSLAALVSNGSISDSASDDDGGFGIRLSHTSEQLDYAVTVQHARQSTPYYELNPAVRAAFLAGADPATAIASSSAATFDAQYPRTWVFGGDMGFEALDATWRFEAAWITDTPVTRTDLRYDTVDSTNVAAGVEFHPGDSDYRVNLQILAINLIDAPSVVDRENIYNFNGSVYGEFGNNRWRTDTRFFFGLDEKDIYINPEIAFIGWEPHEVYLAWHYFNGDSGTIGGYWEDNSLLTLGWRAQF